MAYNHAHPFAMLGTEGEGNYASTIDKDMDQGLTLSPKIKSEEINDPWEIEAITLTHEDIQRILGSEDFGLPLGADIESLLGTMEFELASEEDDVQERNSWADVLLDEPDRPSKKQKLTPPPVVVDHHAVSPLPVLMQQC